MHSRLLFLLYIFLEVFYKKTPSRSQIRLIFFFEYVSSITSRTLSFKLSVTIQPEIDKQRATIIFMLV